MKLKKMQIRAIVLFAVLVLAAVVFNTVTIADPVPKTVQGQVDPNPGDLTIAYPGTAVFYIQNRTSEGQDIDIMYKTLFDQWWSEEFSKDKKAKEFFVLNPVLAMKYAAEQAWLNCNRVIIKTIEDCCRQKDL